MSVSVDDLGPRTKIADGGFGCVYRVPRFRLFGDQDELAYKEFTTDVADQARAARASIGLWDRLDRDERRTFGELFAWPRALVHDASGSVCGLLMPLLGPDYFIDGAKPKPRDMQWLIASEAQRRASGAGVADIDLVDRHVLLTKLAYALGLLHRLRWVYGDLSFKNLVFALDPPRVKLIDCDAAAALSDRGRTQGNTTFWAPPEQAAVPRPLQDTRSDVFKFGLAVLRALTPGTGAATSYDPGASSASSIRTGSRWSGGPSPPTPPSARARRSSTCTWWACSTAAPSRRTSAARP